MKNNFHNDHKDHKEQDKVTLGQEKFETQDESFDSKPVVSDEIYDRDEVRPDGEILEAQEIIKDEPVENKKKTGGKVKIIAGLIIVVLLLILFAESLRTAIFKSSDSLIFLPKDGILIPQVGVIFVVLGLLAAGIALVSLFNKEGKLSRKQKGLTILVGLIVAFLGVSTFFRFVDFKETTIVDKTILTTRAYPYLDIIDVDASTYTEGENIRLKYTYKLQDDKTYEIVVTESNMEEVKKIDRKIKGTARRSIDNYAIQEMERLKMYTKDEALDLFILE